MTAWASIRWVEQAHGTKQPTRLSGVTSTLVLDLKHISHDLAAVSATFRCVYMLGKEAIGCIAIAFLPTLRAHENEEVSLRFLGGEHSVDCKQTSTRQTVH